jgi:hypothetical protein
MTEEDEIAVAVAQVMAFNREQYFAQDILRRIDQARTALEHAKQNPLVWHNDGVGITVTDVLQDAYVEIIRLRGPRGPTREEREKAREARRNAQQEKLKAYKEQGEKHVRMVIDNHLSLKEVAALTGLTQAYLAQKICYKAYSMRAEHPGAARLAELRSTKGVGYKGAIKQYLEEVTAAKNEG